MSFQHLSLSACVSTFLSLTSLVLVLSPPLPALVLKFIIARATALVALDATYPAAAPLTAPRFAAAAAPAGPAGAPANAPPAPPMNAPSPAAVTSDQILCTNT